MDPSPSAGRSPGEGVPVPAAGAVQGDLPSVRREKNRIRALTRDACFRRTPVDRLELMLALFGWRASVYCLTFDPDHLPGSFQEVRRIWRNFLHAMRRWRKQPFDYVYVIEGRHGAHRYHIHLVLCGMRTSLQRRCGSSGLGARWMMSLYCWGPGTTTGGRPGTSARSALTAWYFPSEPGPGWRHGPCTGSLPPLEKCQAEQGEIPVPPDAAWAEENAVRNPFGAYRYAAYIEPNPLKNGAPYTYT